MEIINLKTPSSAESRITDIKQAVKNPNRVNVFVDNEYSFSLDITQLVDLKLKIGMPITPELLAEYQHASAYGKIYQRILEWVLLRPHSVKETKDRLRTMSKKYECQITDQDVAQIIDKLLSRGYLNDQKYAEYYVENRFVKKGISQKRLRMELVKKGIDKSIIEEVFRDGTRSDAEEIQKIIAKKRQKYDDPKLIQYLLRQGFDYELVRNLVQLSSRETDSQNLE